MKILLLNGVNLNTLGSREPVLYGTTTLGDIEQRFAEKAAALGVETLAYQTNLEGELVNFIHQQAPAADGIIINAAAWTHYSIAVRDALGAVAKPFVEVHISNVYAREAFRHHSVLSDKAVGMITGLGWRGYLAALEALVGMLREQPAQGA
ncbi:MAG: type II 3-dehydroquinate dehydratase [Dehalococcoidia bacterium]|nr:type II 3-dehydroquinate dehydratase [Dehalococcoidia bacterium]